MAKCVLEIRDEVNVKFVGLDVKTRRAISDEAKYFLPYAYHMPAYKLGRWDGCVRYCDIGGRTYMNILDKLLPIVQRLHHHNRCISHLQYLPTTILRDLVVLVH